MNQMKKPDWLRIKFSGERNLEQVEQVLKRLSLNTVCEEAGCPNLGECFSRKTATFMILGKMCTRNCTFCNVTKGHTQPVDPDEPLRVAKAVNELGLKHVVVTSVTRDDLPDGGASHYVEVIKRIRELNQTVVIEVLIPDFQGNEAALEKVVQAKPEVINHNVETIPRLYPAVRAMAVYSRSLELLNRIKEKDGSIFTKSGIMVGLGEMEDEVVQVLHDLRQNGCDLLTIGQYLAPSSGHHPIVKYVHPDVFAKYKAIALELGFRFVASSPLVRSSYHADQVSEIIKANNI